MTTIRILRSDMEFEVVTTNCITGKAEYMKEKSDKERLMKICRASSSMPLVSPIVNVDGVPYLDGGLADSNSDQQEQLKAWTIKRLC